MKGQVSSDEARRRWRDLLDEAQRGESAHITRNGKTVAVVVPVEWYRLMLALKAGVYAFTHDTDGGWLPGESNLPVGELLAAIGDAAISELEKVNTA